MTEEIKNNNVTEAGAVVEVDRSLYDFKYEEEGFYRYEEGLTREIVERISRDKDDPEWMRQLRLRSFETYERLKVPDWGPPVDELDMDHIAAYVRPNTDMKNRWEDVPDDIKNTFERLGIPQAERESLAGVGAQYDSELVYHNVRKEVEEQGWSIRIWRARSKAITRRWCRNIL